MTYPEDLDAVWTVKPWRWFASRVGGLLAADTPIARHFATERKE